MRGLALILVQEDEARGEPGPQGEARRRRHLAQETHRRLDEQAATVARLAVRSNRATMSQAVQRTDRGFDHPVAGLIVQAGDEAEPAGISFVDSSNQTPIAVPWILAEATS